MFQKVFCPFNIIFIKNDVSDDESYEEIPLDVPLYPSVDGTSFVVHNNCYFRVKTVCFFRVYDDWFYLPDSFIFLVYTLHCDYSSCIVHETTYLSCQVDRIIHLFNIVCIQFIRAKKLEAVQRSLLHRQGLLLFSHLPRRRQWILGNCKLILVAVMMMTVMKTMLIQKRVKLVMMRFVKLWHSYYFFEYFSYCSRPSIISINIMVNGFSEQPSAGHYKLLLKLWKIVNQGSSGSWAKFLMCMILCFPCIY